MAPTNAAAKPAQHERRAGEIVGARGKRANLRAGAPVLVNIGCGDVFHQRWVNLDFAPRDPRVRRADCRKRLPFPGATMRVRFGAPGVVTAANFDAVAAALPTEMG